MERRERYTTAAGSSPSTLEEIVTAAHNGSRTTFTLEEMRTVLLALEHFQRERQAVEGGEQE
jgi:hypothetical protein